MDCLDVVVLLGEGSVNRVHSECGVHSDFVIGGEMTKHQIWWNDKASNLVDGGLGGSASDRHVVARSWDMPL